MYRFIGLLCVIAVGGLLCGCQTTKEPVIITDNQNDYVIYASTIPHDNVLIYENGNYIGQAPLEFYLTKDNSKVLFFKPGYTPVEMNLKRTTGQRLEVKLPKTNEYLYELIARSGIKFAKRTNFDKIVIEPSNRPISKSSAFYLIDNNKDKRIRLVVTEINNNYLTLETDEGMTVHYPIIHINDYR